MNAIKVEYTVKEEFAPTNKENIQKVMDALKEKNVEGFTYSSWTKEDGKSFVHIVISREGVENPLSEMDVFKNFQAQLKENVEVPPQATKLELVGSSFSL